MNCPHSKYGYCEACADSLREQLATLTKERDEARDFKTRYMALANLPPFPTTSQIRNAHDLVSAERDAALAQVEKLLCKTENLEARITNSKDEAEKLKAERDDWKAKFSQWQACGIESNDTILALSTQLATMREALESIPVQAICGTKDCGATTVWQHQRIELHDRVTFALSLPPPSGLREQMVEALNQTGKALDAGRWPRLLELITSALTALGAKP